LVQQTREKKRFVMPHAEGGGAQGGDRERERERGKRKKRLGGEFLDAPGFYVGQRERETEGQCFDVQECFDARAIERACGIMVRVVCPAPTLFCFRGRAAAAAGRERRRRSIVSSATLFFA
jgi:hypothetical protein